MGKRKVIAYGMSNIINSHNTNFRFSVSSIISGIYPMNAFKADLSYDIEKENSTIGKNF